ncbi:[4Fe-4S] proteins maturation [Coemansia sp. RSA 552]|nr:[4Fe-4S] proteins maturation [Coemansia sp. RSA 552]
MERLLRLRPLLGPPRLLRPLTAPAAAICRTARYSYAQAHSSDAPAPAKYSLRKLDRQEIADLEGKLADYSRPPQNTTDQPQHSSRLAPGASEAEAVRLTDSAIERLKYLSKKRGKTQYLRLRVDSGGCYGFSYMLDMTEEPADDDVVVDRNGAKMVVDKVSLPLVRGAVIDWQDRLIGQAFLVVANPQSSGGCGCGSSFEIKMD